MGSFYHWACALTCVLSISLSQGEDAPEPDFSYCIVGAGPGGVQSAYYLKKRKADFAVFERGPGAGTFYETYPRHRTLISINKKFTGKGGLKSEQFNMRHDWNSLLSDDGSGSRHEDDLKFGKYTDKYFSDAQFLVTYLQDFVEKTGIHPHIQYNSSAEIRRLKGSGLFQITVKETGKTTTCRAVICAPGLWKPHRPHMEGEELLEEYQDMSVDPKDFVNQTVAILGNGNAALETANRIFNVTKQVHVIGRRPARFSWMSHYVGDIRAVNSDHIDRYQLVGGSDTVLEMNPLPRLAKDPQGGIILIPPWGQDPTEENIRALKTWQALPKDASLMDRLTAYDTGARGYKDLGWMKVDRVLRCLGWRIEQQTFPDGDEQSGTESAKPELNDIEKYPVMTATFESVNQKGLYFAGTVTHGRDFRKSSGGFIHGFRYNSRVLDKWLQVRYHKKRWDSELLSPARPMLLADRILGSANNGDGIYQMFGQLVDVITFNLNSQGQLSGRHYKEMPKELAQKFTINNFRITMDLRYGKNFTGPIFDVFSVHRVTSSPPDSHLSNFLHPVLDFYTPGQLTPNSTFHILEDLRTDFTQSIHLTPTIEHFKSVCKQLPDMIRAHLHEKEATAKCASVEGGKCAAKASA